jgi:hypothetical protein
MKMKSAESMGYMMDTVPRYTMGVVLGCAMGDALGHTMDNVPGHG